MLGTKVMLLPDHTRLLQEMITIRDRILPALIVVPDQVIPAVAEDHLVEEAVEDNLISLLL